MPGKCPHHYSTATLVAVDATAIKLMGTPAPEKGLYVVG